MRRRYMIGTVMAGSALLAACGSTSTQSLKPTPAPTAKKSATTTSATTSEYLNIYQGIPNSPVSSNGYPFSVPDSMRILAPKLLSKEVLDTKLAKIGDTYVGTTWTPAQRMEIYTAKMFALYLLVDAPDQYMPNNTNNRINIWPNLVRVAQPFYGSRARTKTAIYSTTAPSGSHAPFWWWTGDVSTDSESNLTSAITAINTTSSVTAYPSGNGEAQVTITLAPHDLNIPVVKDSNPAQPVDNLGSVQTVFTATMSLPEHNWSTICDLTHLTIATHAVK